MIHVICPGTRLQAGDIVTSALRRSCGQTQVHSASIDHLLRWLYRPAKACWVIVDPLELWSAPIIKALQTPQAKVMVLGAIPPSLAHYLNVTVAPLAEEIREEAACVPAPAHGFSESPVHISYRRAMGDFECPVRSRPLLRYDFTDEWNNLGYGAIRSDGSIWALSQQVQIPSQALTLADVRLGDSVLSAYCGLWEWQGSSLLWFNRPTGPVDSQEWRLVEVFLSNHRHQELPCWPVISEIPHGYDAAVTMRLDCDEDVESARPLWEAYRRMNVPFSLALHTGVLADQQHHALPREVLAKGGALLSHTATHAPDWGGSYTAALNEGWLSATTIRDITGHPIRYAVSPFHQTPDYARAGLADAGYAGCIGGIIRNDPDFLMARAGVPPGSSTGFIGHSQQFMLHGDCMLESGDSLKIFKQAFDMAKTGKAFFGYLDHPFSPRYQYGWASETQRIAMHQEYVAYMQRSGNVLFCNEDDAMDFLGYKSAISVTPVAGTHRIAPSPGHTGKWPVTVEYAGELHCLPGEGMVL